MADRTLGARAALNALRSRLARVGWLKAAYRRWRDPDLAALERSLAAGVSLTVLQPYTTTGADRYPALFDRLAELLAHRDEPRVLSLGCADGGELRALRQRLPGAWLIGVDVNPRAIGRARRRDRHARSCYLIGDAPPPGHLYDAALALAVFRHGALGRDRPGTCTGALPFAVAARVFGPLDRALPAGALLAWGNTHFRLSDMPGGDRYDLVAHDLGLPPADVLYGPDDRRIDGVSDSGGIYRKR